MGEEEADLERLRQHLDNAAKTVERRGRMLADLRAEAEQLRTEVAHLTRERDDAYLWVPDGEGGVLARLRAEARDRREAGLS